jgi:alkaline phosphatase D
MIRIPLRTTLLLVLLAAAGCLGPAKRPPSVPGAETPLETAHYVGEMTPRSATLWARCAGATEVLINLAPGASGALRAPVDAARDHTARFTLVDLEPDTSYRYTLWCPGAGKPKPQAGAFRTPPEADERGALRFAWVGDVGGQNVCRDRDRGYLPFLQVEAIGADFLIALGDMIYADDACLETGRYGNAQIPGPTAPAQTVEEFRAHWRYGRADRYLQRAFARSGVYPIWDDHEIRNDAGPSHDSHSWRWWDHLTPAARQAFLDYNPIGTADTDGRLYRSVRWGHHAEFFILDTRSYRDSNGDRDRGDKTLLGAEQKAWLIEALSSSNATWKVIVSSVPISIPTGDDELGRDGWADYDSGLGFESELTEILRVIQGLTKRQVVFLTTDVHFGAAFRYVPFPDDPDFVFHELVSGPLISGVFPRSEVDTTFNPERLYRHAPERAEDITSFEDALRWFNFGVVEIDEAGSLKARIVQGDGTTAYELSLRP